MENKNYNELEFDASNIDDLLYIKSIFIENNNKYGNIDAQIRRFTDNSRFTEVLREINYNGPIIYPA